MEYYSVVIWLILLLLLAALFSAFMGMLVRDSDINVLPLDFIVDPDNATTTSP